MKTPEAYTKDALKADFKAQGFYYFCPVQMGIGAVGLDFYVCAHGQFWGVEAKREGIREVTPRQRDTMRKIRAAGGRTFLVTMEGKALVWIETFP